MKPEVLLCVFRSAVVCLLVLTGGTLLHAQVNTERMRRSELEPGWSNRIGVNFALVDGNTEFLKLGVSARSDLLSGDWYSFLVGNYERGLTDGDVFINKGFVHLRGVHSFSPVVAAEAFVQKEFNDFLRLHDRNLAGGGARLRLVYITPDSLSSTSLNVFLGVGGMYENEVTTGEGGETKNLVRSTNYLSLRWRSSELIGLSATGYFQPAVTEPDDFRALADATLSIYLIDVIAFTTSLAYRYDSQPPPDLRRFDIELQNGLVLTF